jgi:periplasmic divalent cation tolerance protein
MQPAKEVILVFVTVPNQVEASKISEEVLKSHEAACATIIPSVHSKYWWEGQLINEQECLIVLKTTAARFQALQDTILKVHSYKVPEIIALPLTDGFPQYLEWIKRETSQ